MPHDGEHVGLLPFPSFQGKEMAFAWIAWITRFRSNGRRPPFSPLPTWITWIMRI
jgi:hypothetical protein